jgi:hypothetical protein
MEHHRLDLTDAEYNDLNSRYPKTTASGIIGKRAEEIILTHGQDFRLEEETRWTFKRLAQEQVRLRSFTPWRSLRCVLS